MNVFNIVSPKDKHFIALPNYDIIQSLFAKGTCVYQAGIHITDGDQTKRESGLIHITGGLVWFKNDERSFNFPASTANLSFGGTANRTVYISHTAKKDITLFTSDFRILKEDAFQTNPDAQSVTSKRKRHHSATFLILLALALFVLGPLYLVFIERDILSGYAASKVPWETEEKIGSFLFKAQFMEGSMIKDSAILSDFKKVSQPLIDVAEKDGHTFKIYIMDNPQTNAFAMPGGYIVMMSGLIENAQTTEEILGVLAHEMAHVTQRHSLKQVISDLSGYILLNILLSGAGDLAFIVSDNATHLLSQHYSRAQEEEADEIGFAYLVEAGISPQGLIDFFDRLQFKINGIDPAWFEIISTHPSSKNRVENLQDMLQDYGRSFKPVDFPLQSFQDRLSELTVNTNPDFITIMEKQDETKN